MYSYTCIVCNRKLCPDNRYLTRGTPYVAVIDGNYCCADCVEAHSGPGKFEAHDRTRGELGKALILHSMMGDYSYMDDSMYAEGWGFCARIGKYLVIEDDRGFVTFEEYRTDAEVEKRYDELYTDGWGASEDDAYIQDSYYRGYDVSFNGKPLHVWENKNGEITYRRCLAAIRLEMMRTGYYPNVWHVSDHGNISLVKGI